MQVVLPESKDGALRVKIDQAKQRLRKFLTEMTKIDKFVEIFDSYVRIVPLLVSKGHKTNIYEMTHPQDDQFSLTEDQRKFIKLELFQYLLGLD